MNGTDNLLLAVREYEDSAEADFNNPFVEPTVHYDEDFPEIVLYVDFPDGTTLINDLYDEERDQAAWLADADRVAGRMWDQ